MSTQRSPQSVGVAPPQLSPQDPSLHTSPASQLVSHAPQWFRSLVVSTQRSPQSVGVAPPQLSPQDPSLHTSPAPQLVPQAPQ